MRSAPRPYSVVRLDQALGSTTPEEHREIIRKIAANFAQIVKQANIKPQ